MPTIGRTASLRRERSGPRPRALLLAAVAAAAAAWAGPGLAAGTAAGTIEAAAGRVSAAVPGGAVLPLAAGAGVPEGAVVATGEASAASIRFADGSLLTLGAGTRAAVDRFAYDPATRRGSLAVRVVAGAFGFASGAMEKAGYAITTPFANLSLRGTEISVDVANEAIFVVEGEALARFLTGETLSLKPSECTFRTAGLRTRASGLTCGESFEALAPTFAALREGEGGAAFEILRGLGVRLPSPDRRSASPD